MDWPHIYVHVPFCGRRCSYCDFAIAVRKQVPVSEFNDAILAELVTRRVATQTQPLRSLYFGGGTPSKLGGSGLAELIHNIRRFLDVDKFSTSVAECEITVEANPEDISTDAAAAWVAAGVNRVSLGVQSFNPDVLAWMHRGHGPEKVADSLRILRAAGIQEISVDLIFAVPEHLNRSWTEDLDRALELRPDHISLYGLTVEPGTPLGRWVERAEVVESPEDRYADQFLEAHHRLVAAGFEHYEVSNYALPNKRARHNSAYWSGAPYLGLGPSAHGFDGNVRRWNRPAYAAWLAEVQSGLDPIEGQETIGPDSRVAEQVYLGLRTVDGLDVRQNEVEKVTPWIAQGWAELRDGAAGGRLVLTATGWLRLDAIAATLTSLRSRS